MPGNRRLKSRLWLAAVGILAASAIAQQGQRQPAAGLYADPAVCETCHRDIAVSYHETGMGRSFYRLSAETAIEDFAPGKPFYHEASHTYLAMIERGGKYYQRRWQLGFDGRETNVDEKQIDYVLGSGNHSRTYLHLTLSNTLQELPLGWYAEKGGYWAMQPGFDQPDYPGSTRAVTYQCMYCHNAYPSIPKGHEEPGARAEFLAPIPLGIDCQRCHGPGQRHVEAARRAGASAEEIRATIVNPKRLSADREMEVCLQCHLETTTEALPGSILRVGRGPFSYIPGEPLAAFRLSFDRAGGMGERFEIASAPYRLRQSQCFLKSAGKLRCDTCHDPHDIPRGEAASLHYNAVCRDCHGRVLPPPAQSATHAAGANCVSCHMPKRRTDDGVHIVMTDHLIQRKPPAGDLLAEKPETHETGATAYRGEVIPYYPARLASTGESALYLAVAQVLERSNLAVGLPRLESLIQRDRPQAAEFYVDLAQGLSAAGERAKAVTWFEEAARRAPASAIVLRKLGSAQMDAGQLANAEASLRRSSKLDPGDAGAWAILGQVLWREGKPAEARATMEKGIEADPEHADSYSALGELLLARGDATAAEKEFREAIRVRPGFAEAHANLASLLASKGGVAEARFHFEEALRLKPDYAEAHLNYGRLLASVNETAQAEKEAQTAVAQNAKLAGAHQLWGALLATRGDNDGALRELQTAVQLQPNYGRAQFELAVVLGRKGDRDAAAEHLKLAAQSNDPEARTQAQQLLQRLGRR